MFLHAATLLKLITNTTRTLVFFLRIDAYTVLYTWFSPFFRHYMISNHLSIWNSTIAQSSISVSQIARSPEHRIQIPSGHIGNVHILFAHRCSKRRNWGNSIIALRILIFMSADKTFTLGIHAVGRKKREWTRGAVVARVIPEMRSSTRSSVQSGSGSIFYSVPVNDKGENGTEWLRGFTMAWSVSWARSVGVSLVIRVCGWLV